MKKQDVDGIVAKQFQNCVECFQEKYSISKPMSKHFLSAARGTEVAFLALVRWRLGYIIRR